MRLGRIFNQGKPVPVGQSAQSVNVRHLAEQVYSHDRRGTRSHGGGYRVRIHQQCVRADIDECRVRSHRADRLDCADEGVRRHDDFVAGTDVERGQDHLECICPVGDSHAMRGLTVFREAGLKAFDHGTADELAIAQDGAPGIVEFGVDLAMTRADIE